MSGTGDIAEMFCAECGHLLAHHAIEGETLGRCTAMGTECECARFVPIELPAHLRNACCAETRREARRESTDNHVRFLIRQGLGPLGKLTGREFAAHVAGGILATEPTSVSVEEVAVLDGRTQPFTVAAASEGSGVDLGETFASAAAALLAANPPPDSGLWEPEVSTEECDGKTIVGLVWKPKQGDKP